MLRDQKRNICKNNEVRLRSVVHAGRGVWLFVTTTPNAWVHIFVFFFMVLLGLFFSISKIEWLILMLAAGLVFVAEAFNSAIEIDIDLTSPDYHPFARDTKDTAAGAVLIASLFAFLIGLFIFTPRLLVFFISQNIL